jgi:hypothetical protein
VIFLTVRERELLARGTPPAAAFKLFGLLQCVDGTDPAAFARAWAEAASTPHGSQTGTALTKPTQNDVLALLAREDVVHAGPDALSTRIPGASSRLNIIGPDALVFGVAGIASGAQYLTACGLTPLVVTAAGARQDDQDGSVIGIAHASDPAQPPAPGTASIERKTIHGVHRRLRSSQPLLSPRCSSTHLSHITGRDTVAVAEVPVEVTLACESSL